MKRNSIVLLGFIILSIVASCDKPEDEHRTVTDIDGNAYSTVVIGDQEWMAENLKVTHYRDGTAIPNVTDNALWVALTTGAFCISNNNASNEVDTYGALYNWYATVDSRNIAPTGWHVPTDDEWKELEMSLGMSQVEADTEDGHRGTNEASKLAGNAALWDNGVLENDSEFGSSGFTALPGGFRNGDYNYYSMGYRAFFWSATDNNGLEAWYRDLSSSKSELIRNYGYKSFGLSVRCVKD